jgi:hypothetical protein
MTTRHWCHVTLNTKYLDQLPNRTKNPSKIQSNGAIKETISGLDEDFRHERKTIAGNAVQNYVRKCVVIIKINRKSIQNLLQSRDDGNECGEYLYRMVNLDRKLPKDITLLQIHGIN